MGLLDTEILSNRWDVENSLNNAMNKTAMAWGQLDRTKYAPMTASTALQGDMYGRSLGSMLGGQHPELQKQDIIDDIMKRYPDPRTSTELREVSKEFAKAGLTDYSFQIMEVANELYKTEVTKDKATDKWYTGISKTLQNNLLTRPIVEMYAKELYGINDEDWNNRDKYTMPTINQMMKDAKAELIGQMDNYANRKMMDNLSKSDIKKLKSNDATFTQDFFADLTQYGNTDIVNFLQSVVDFDSTGGKATMIVNAEFRTRIKENDLSELDDLFIKNSITDLLSKKKAGTITKIQQGNLTLLQAEEKKRAAGQVDDVDARILYLKSQHPKLGTETEEEYEKRIRGMVSTEQFSSANISYTGDAVVDWVIPSGRVVA